MNPIAYALVPLILVIGWTTQLSPLATVGIGREPDTASLQQYVDLKKAAGVVQGTFRPGCQILQLPIMEYPEGGMVGEVMNGNHLWLPLLTEGLRWSYGGPKGTVDGDYWKPLVGTEPSLAIDQARSDEFCGLVVDIRSGIDFEKLSLEDDLESVGPLIANYAIFRFVRD